ncbi:hypothetical protein Patl1_22693 [Pistacia atlantica]|uniref:Uncharacterized protein n=1 Tax=Pistacia atlantica TaxID=434234 RepID=A0ACC0ZX12_9ROSI|nr:hypothetical protein Patl1_22693 [Pistacia atlantica]
MAGIQKFPVRSVFLYLVLIIFSKLSFGGSSSKHSSGFRLKLIPRDSPKSPLYPGNLTHLEKMERLIDFTKAKAELRRMRFHTSPSSSMFDDEKYIVALRRQAFYYIAEMKLGIPGQLIYLVLDTTADLIWTQCEPCVHCFDQEAPIFDPKASMTYSRVPCRDRHCSYGNENDYFTCLGGYCTYNLTYNNSLLGSTIGSSSRDYFHFYDDTSGYSSTKFNLFFGCSNYTTNLSMFIDPQNIISGVMGLNLSPLSLNSQLKDRIQGKFAYCVIPWDENFPFDVHALPFDFGDDVVLPQRKIPMEVSYAKVGDANEYYLDLRDISVADSHCFFVFGTFDPAPGEGFILDSTSPITMLTKNATKTGINVYDKVITKLRNYYQLQHLSPLLGPDNPTNYELCYKNKENFTDFAWITYHFRKSADYVVDAKFMNINYSGGFFCVALLGNDGPQTVLGLFHMQNMRIIHHATDFDHGSIQFYPADCAEDHF